MLQPTKIITGLSRIYKFLPSSIGSCQIQVRTTWTAAAGDTGELLAAHVNLPSLAADYARPFSQTWTSFREQVNSLLTELYRFGNFFPNSKTDFLGILIHGEKHTGCSHRSSYPNFKTTCPNPA